MDMPMTPQSAISSLDEKRSSEIPFAALVAALERDLRGAIGVCVRHVESGDGFAVNGCASFPMASTYDLPLIFHPAAPRVTAVVTPWRVNCCSLPRWTLQTKLLIDDSGHYGGT